MSSPAVRSVGIVAIVVLSLACGPSFPTAPLSSDPGLTEPRLEFPPPSGPLRTFVFDSAQTALLRSAYWRSDVMDYTKNSFFLLYDNGASALLYTSLSAPPLRGRYHDANGVLNIIFEFQGRAVNETWDDAIGTLRGDVLTLEFGGSMQHADFEDAAYARLR
jgi:hypothetical protein